MQYSVINTTIEPSTKFLDLPLLFPNNQELISKSHTQGNLYLGSTWKNFPEKVVDFHSLYRFIAPINATYNNFFLVDSSDPATHKIDD